MNTDVESGEFVRRRGCDLGEGQKILGKGERIRAATACFACVAGFGEGCGRRRSARGDRFDWRRTGETRRTTSTRARFTRAIRSFCTSLLQRCGAVVTSTRHCRDNERFVAQGISSGSQKRNSDRHGRRFSRRTRSGPIGLEALGAKIDIWRVAIKPGKPFLFGRLGECAVFGLPGNPVSAFVTFLQFVRPAILKMMGARNLDLPQSAGEIGCRSDKRRRSRSLFPRQVRIGKFCAGRPPGIARAFWLESIECAASAGDWRIAPARRNG